MSEKRKVGFVGGRGEGGWSGVEWKECCTSMLKRGNAG